MIPRRDLIVGALLAAVESSCSRVEASEVESDLAALERRHGGRLGVAILDTAAVHAVSHGKLRPDRFTLSCNRDQRAHLKTQGRR